MMRTSTIVSAFLALLPGLVFPALAGYIPLARYTAVTGLSPLVEFHAADMDNDADEDLLILNSGSEIQHYRNDGGSFSYVGFFSATAMFCLTVHDMNGDGINDIVSSLFTGIDNYVRIDLHDGAGTFVQEYSPALTAAAVWIAAADLDHDGDGDLVFLDNSTPATYLIRNDGAGSYAIITIDPSLPGNGNTIDLADFDGDGEPDAVWPGGTSGVGWAMGGSGASFEASAYELSNLVNATAAFAADMDGDGDPDIVVADQGMTTPVIKPSKIVWLENEGGASPSFATSHDILGTGSAGDDLFPRPCDMDGDGDTDLVWTSYMEDRLYWSENLDGSGDSWNHYLVDESIVQPSQTWTGLLDDNEYPDPLAYDSGNLYWYANTQNLPYADIGQGRDAGAHDPNSPGCGVHAGAGLGLAALVCLLARPRSGFPGPSP
jgi:hypothetical protein